MFSYTSYFRIIKFNIKNFLKNRNLILFLYLFFIFSSFFSISLAVPLEVIGVVAEPGDAKVTLTWKKGHDPFGKIAGYKIYYGTESVIQAGKTYTNVLSLSGNLTKHTILSLKNGVKYYFAITAVYKNGKESLTYSKEIQSVPLSKDEMLQKYPAILSVKEYNHNELQVIMSKPIKINGNKIESFYIEAIDNFETVQIWQVKIDPYNKKKIVLFLRDDGLVPGKLYRLGAMKSIKDFDGNSIKTGYRDTFSFTAKPKSQINQPYKVTKNPFEIKKEKLRQDNQEKIRLKNEHERITQQKIPMKKELHSSATQNINYNTAPLDVSEVWVDSYFLLSKGIVVVSWKSAPDVDNDIVNQIIQVKKSENSDWEDSHLVGINKQEFHLPVVFEQNYELKIMTVDNKGNRSNGVIVPFSSFTSRAGANIAFSLVFIFIFCSFVIFSWKSYLLRRQ